MLEHKFLNKHQKDSILSIIDSEDIKYIANQVGISESMIKHYLYHTRKSNHAQFIDSELISRYNYKINKADNGLGIIRKGIVDICRLEDAYDNEELEIIAGLNLSRRKYHEKYGIKKKRRKYVSVPVLYMPINNKMVGLTLKDIAKGYTTLLHDDGYYYNHHFWIDIKYLGCKKSTKKVD